MRIPALMLAGAIGLAGCVTLSRSEPPPQQAQQVAPVGFSPAVRFLGVDWRLERPPADIIEGLRSAATDGSLDILALSGGGAGGAFGAGALVGLSRARARPQFELVTGVSTGALIAPFAFLGSNWDQQLTEAFVGPRSNDLMQRHGLLAVFSASLFGGDPLVRLIDHFVTQTLVDAVAREAAKGRLLLVATTDLDKAETVFWNMGAIASMGGDPARGLFRDVLIASASIPGIFPPVMIHVRDAAGAAYDEMHVDGSTTIPFFIAPEAILVSPGEPQGVRGGNIYLIVNTQLTAMPRTTPINTMTILARGFSSSLAHNARTALAQSEEFSTKIGMSFRYTAIPGNEDFDGFLDFDAAKMRGLFDYASACAARGQLWLSTVTQALDQAANPASPTAVEQPKCPLGVARTAE